MEEHNDDDAEDNCRDDLNNADDDDGAGDLFHDNQDDDGSLVSSRGVTQGLNMGCVWAAREGHTKVTPGSRPGDTGARLGHHWS